MGGPPQANALLGDRQREYQHRQRERRRFEPEQIELAQTITSQVAISVHNAQLFGETVARQRELGILSEAGRVLATSLDLNTVAERAADYFMRSLNTAGCAVSLLDDSGELLTLSEVTRQPLAGTADERGDLLKLPAVRRVIAEREGMLIRAVTTELGSSQASWMRRRGITSMLMLPLLIYHQIQLIVCAVIARFYADHPGGARQES